VSQKSLLIIGEQVNTSLIVLASKVELFPLFETLREWMQDSTVLKENKQHCGFPSGNIITT
jgi:hypothetical protein